MYLLIFYTLTIMPLLQCTVKGCKVCLSHKHFQGEQQGLGKSGPTFHYVMFIGCGALKKPLGCECELVKHIPNFPHLGPKLRSDPALLALFCNYRTDDVEIVKGLSPEQMKFDVEQNGAEVWVDRYK